MLESKVLITGFEPFGPYRYNVSEQLVEALDGEIIDLRQDTRLQIISVSLPINFGTFRKILEEAIQSIRPKIALGLGMDFKDHDHLSLELIAHSTPDYGDDIQDTEDNIGPNGSLDTLSETIRIPNEEHIKSAISAINGIQVSEEAGRHMCETVLRDLIRISGSGKKFQPGFIHLPHTDDLLQDSEHLDKHVESMPIGQQIEIVRKVIKSIGTFYL